MTFRRIIELLHHRECVTAKIALLVFAGTWLIQSLGGFEFFELFIYDRWIESRPQAQREDPRIAIIEVTEPDIQKYDFPLSDELLAKVLAQIAAQGPRAIGVDIYRDLPVPRDGSGKAALDRVLAGNPNIVWIFKFSDQHARGIPPPAFFQNAPERVGFNDYPVDDKIIRRGLLFLSDGQTVVESLSLRLAELYLAAEQPPIGPEADPVDTRLMRLGRTTFRRVTPNAGGYIGTDAGGYQFFLDFAGPRQFASWTLDEFLTGKLPPDFAHDRIVLIGSTAESLKDVMATPLRFNEHGVVLNAKVINQLLRAALEGDRSVRVWTDHAETAWLLLWCAVGAATAFFLHGPWRTTLTLAAGVFALWSIVGRAFAANWWIPFSPPLFGHLTTAGFVIAYIAHFEKKERAMLFDLFRRNVSQDVAESLWQQREQFAERGRPLPQSHTATLLFTDLAGFTTTSEELDPADVMEWLNSYMEVMSAQVDRHGGVLISYIGDAIMAAFGVPVARRTDEEINRDAANAVCCALAMRAELDKFNAQRAAAGAAPTRMRVGIFTGTVVAGCLGSANRLAYTTIGDTVNTAQRLESFDKDYADPTLPPTDCRILIGEPTQRRLDSSAFVTKRLPNAHLKGKTKETAIYWVVGEQKVAHASENNQPDPGDLGDPARAPALEPARTGK